MTDFSLTCALLFLKSRLAKRFFKPNIGLSDVATVAFMMENGWHPESNIARLWIFGRRRGGAG